MSEHFCVAQAQETLRSQREVIRHVRTQAAVVSSFSFLVFRFMSDSNGQGMPNLLFISDYVAATLFLVSITFALAAAVMQQHWYFSITKMQAEKLFKCEQSDLDDLSLSMIKCEVLFGFANENNVKISRVNSTLNVAYFSAVLQLVFWLL